MSGTAPDDAAERAVAAPWGTSRIRVAFVATALVLIAVHLLWPTGPLGDATYLAAVGGAAVMAWVGALRRPRGASRIPTLIAAGITASALGDLIWYLTSVEWRGAQRLVGRRGLLPVLRGTGGGAGARHLVRTGAGARIDPDSIIDALTIIVVSVLVFWDLSIADIVADTTVSGFTRVVWATYPVLDAILLAMVARVVGDPALAVDIGVAFAGGVACWLVADIGICSPSPRRSVAFLDAGWMLGAILMATAAWRRPAADAALVADDARPAHPFWKLGIATAPILVPLALHFVDDLRGGEGNVLADPDQCGAPAGAQLRPECPTAALRESRADRGPREPGRRPGGIARQVGVPGHDEP